MDPNSIVPRMNSLTSKEEKANFAIEVWQECVDLGEITPLTALHIARVTEGLSTDEEAQMYYFDNIDDNGITTWWDSRSPEEDALVKDTFEKLGLIDWKTGKGILLDNYLLQTPPEENKAIDKMSPEAREKYRMKYGV